MAISAALARSSAMHVRLQTHEQRCLVALPMLQLKRTRHRCVAAFQHRQQWSSQPTQLVKAVLRLALVHALELYSWPVCRCCIAPPATMTAEPVKQGWTALITGATGIQVSREIYPVSQSHCLWTASKGKGSADCAGIVTTIQVSSLLKFQLL